METGRTLGQPLSLQTYWGSNLEQVTAAEVKPLVVKPKTKKEPKKPKSKATKKPKSTVTKAKKSVQSRQEPKKKIRTTQLPWT